MQLNGSDINEIFNYWRNCLGELGKRPDHEVAYDMVAAAVNGPFDTWYEDRGHPGFKEVWDIVTHLETPDGSPEWRRAQWERVHELPAK